MTMKQLLKIGFLTTVTALSLMGLDNETYYKLDIQAMQMTLDGAKERLHCLEDQCPLNEQYAIDDRVQQKIVTLYTEAGTTPSKHSGYYTQHSQTLKSYYDNNSALSETYLTLQDEIEAVNSQLKTLMEQDQ